MHFYTAGIIETQYQTRFTIITCFNFPAGNSPNLRATAHLALANPMYHWIQWYLAHLAFAFAMDLRCC